jgi:hypothetical protein
MKHFVQLKDGVVFAYHSSSTEVDIPGDNIIEVAEEGVAYLNKKHQDGNFIDAPVIKYAVLDASNDNTVIGIETTLFSSDVKGPVITNDEVKILWKFDGESFVGPTTISPVEIILAPTPEVVPDSE